MNPTLLVTDDSMIIREMIKDVAIGAGWTIVGEAVNGQEAISQYQLLRPMVVTLDLTMPEFDGLYALRGMREFDPAARILVVSAIDQAPIIKEAIDLGAADFIVKPFDPVRLLKAIDLLARQTQPQWQSKSCLMAN
jgi:two-component system, chemotaxis family, chemotaxis protein CheY